MTVRQALGELVNEGYITKIKGKVSIVIRKERKGLGVLSVRGFSDIVSSAKKKVSTRFIERPSHKDWPDSFFYDLSEQEKRVGAVFLKRIRLVDDVPVMLESTYMPDIELANFAQVEFVNGSLFDTLNAIYEIEIINVEQDLRAIIPDNETREILDIPKNAAALQVYLKFLTNKPYFSIYSSLICDTTTYSISNVL